jgi:hypothetical protein
MIINPFLFTPWTPSNMTLDAWYDGADTGTITLSSGKVSTWATKAGSTRNLTQGTAANQPTYVSAGSYLEFDGVNDVLSGSGFTSNTAITVFIMDMAYTNNDVIDSNKSSIHHGTTSTSNPDWWITNPTHDDTQGAANVDTSATFKARNLTSSRDAAHTMAMTCMAANSDGLARLDGGAESGPIISTTNNLQNGTNRSLIVGRQKVVSTRYHQGRVYEIIIKLSRMFPTDADYLKIEGYLAHKWGLTGNLPSDHIYKNNPPYI